MNKITTSLLSATLATAATLSSGAAMAEFSANAAVVSNYVFRGLTYSDENPAVQGGLDYSHEVGAYVGIWASTIDTGFETGIEYDYYLGFANEVGDFGYDVGYVVYTNDDNALLWEDSQEFYLKGSYSMFSAGYYLGDMPDVPDSDYTYLELGADIELPMEMTLGLHYGIYDPDAAGADEINDYSVGISKDISGIVDVAVIYSNEDLTDENYVWLEVSKVFEF